MLNEPIFHITHTLSTLYRRLFHQSIPVCNKYKMSRFWTDLDIGRIKFPYWYRCWIVISWTWRDFYKAYLHIPVPSCCLDFRWSLAITRCTNCLYVRVYTVVNYWKNCCFTWRTFSINLKHLSANQRDRQSIKRSFYLWKLIILALIGLIWRDYNYWKEKPNNVGFQ